MASFWSPITWATPILLLAIGGSFLLDTPLTPRRLLTASRPPVLYAYLFVYLLVTFWQGQVTHVVPEPYLDEVFHIPQAQAYHQGKYDVWDPKLTTPPGLYIFSTFFTKIFSPECPVYVLRTVNVFALIMLMSEAADCRSLISLNWTRSPALNVAAWFGLSKPMKANSIHAALNIALFPLLFFFSGLFYTDVLSTCVVLRMYRLFLERKGAYVNTAEGLLWMYPTGIFALTMRQTNIFWVAIFMGGLEAVRTIKSNPTANDNVLPAPQTWHQIAIHRFNQYRDGEIHDIPLKDAGVHDFVLCAISIAVAALFRPLILLTRLWPYIALLGSFGGFVFWNGGVVLGDKANHVATIHIPQLLYIWPLITFFSVPLMIPVAFYFLQSIVKLLSLPLFPRLFWKYMLVSTYIGTALSATTFVIRFNTIIHPFTLADNRHYMFYVFRYTILRHELIRYFLAPVYLGCGYLVYLTLCTQPPPATSPSLKQKNASVNTKVLPKKQKAPEQQGPKTSFVLILLITTALSLITAPLVEPRYFIIPWVIWRLNVPSLPSPASSPAVQDKEAKPSVADDLQYWGWLTGDYRLWFETFWFLIINAVTGYVFLFKGFEWKQEPGNVQRFMW